MHLREPHSHETIGDVLGLGVHGSFHEWQDGERQRRDDTLGIRTQREMRIGDRLYVQNPNGDVRELHGLLARRQVTEDFIDTGAFAAHPEAVQFLGTAVLPDGRNVYRLRITPPSGEAYNISLDAKTWLVDQKSYVDGDDFQTITYDDYHVVDGMLIPYLEVQSNGDHQFDITTHVSKVVVNQPIPADVFVPFAPTLIDAVKPVTVQLEKHNGLLFTRVKIHEKTFAFLVDSGAQGIVLDTQTAQSLGLLPQGHLQIRGTGRTAGRGIVDLDALQIGDATLPVHVASVVDLSRIVQGPVSIEGILGYPFFAAAEVRIDPDRLTMIVAKPTSLNIDGEKVELDTDRELPEVRGTVNGAPARLFVDTGNSGELLIFQSFMDEHKGLIQTVGNRQVTSRGVGGGNNSVSALVTQLELGSYRLFNRQANIVLAHSGAFADKTDGGNIGYGTLKNFVVTFDVANHALYLQRASTFDDGRYRAVLDPNGTVLTPPQQ
jgi:predicted aspartyl protease